MRLSNILNLPVKTAAEAEALGTLEDGLLDLQERRVTYWRVKLTHKAATVLVCSRNVKIGESGVSVTLPRDALEAASDKDSNRVNAEGGAPQSDVLPAASPEPKPTGLWRIVYSVIGREAPPVLPEKPANTPQNWVWGDEMRGARFLAGEGELGRIRDLEIEPSEQRLRRIQVAQRGGVTLHVRASAMRHLPDESCSFVAKSAMQLTEKPGETKS